MSYRFTVIWLFCVLPVPCLVLERQWSPGRRHYRPEQLGGMPPAEEARIAQELGSLMSRSMNSSTNRA